MKLEYKQPDMNKLKAEKDINEADIKKLIKQQWDEDYYITFEKSEGGQGNQPFDVILGHKKTYDLIGMEIKGDTDTFKRLKNQMDAYVRCFDEIYLILHKQTTPSWLTDVIGVIRISETGEMFIENFSNMRNYMNITTDWETVLKSNDIHVPREYIQRAYEAAGDIRKNVLFNRFFAIHEWGNQTYTKFFPLSDYQKEIIIGFNIKELIKVLHKQIKNCEKSLELIKEAINLSK